LKIKKNPRVTLCKARGQKKSSRKVGDLFCDLWERRNNSMRQSKIQQELKKPINLTKAGFKTVRATVAPKLCIECGKATTKTDSMIGATSKGSGMIHFDCIPSTCYACKKECRSGDLFGQSDQKMCVDCLCDIAEGLEFLAEAQEKKPIDCDVCKAEDRGAPYPWLDAHALCEAHDAENIADSDRACAY